MISAQSFKELNESGMDISDRNLIVHTLRIYGNMCLVDAVETMFQNGLRRDPSRAKNFGARIDEARRFGGFVRKTGRTVISEVSGKEAEEWAYVPHTRKGERLKAMLQERQERLQRRIKECDEAEQRVRDAQDEVDEMEGKVYAASEAPV